MARNKTQFEQRGGGCIIGDIDVDVEKFNLNNILLL